MNTRLFNPTKDNSWIVCNLSSVEEAVEAEQQGANAIEFRCDLALEDGKDPLAVLKQIREAVTLPILGTIRQAGDGGSWFYAYQGNELERMELFKKIVPYVDALDIEIDSEIKKELRNLARGYQVKIIASYHNFISMDNEEEIVKTLEEAKALGGDIIKLAYFTREHEDVLRLFKILRRYDHRVPLTLIGMGPAGIATRIVFPCFGSCITYGYIEGFGSGPGAPGQIPIKEIDRCLKDVQRMKVERGSDCSDETILEFILNYEFSGAIS